MYSVVGAVKRVGKVIRFVFRSHPKTFATYVSVGEAWAAPIGGTGRDATIKGEPEANSGTIGLGGWVDASCLSANGNMTSFPRIGCRVSLGAD